MNDGLIPQRYAKALYKFAKGNGNEKRVYDDMKNVIASFDSNPDLQKVMSNPFVDKADKSRLLLSAAGSDASEDYKGFVKLIVAHNREEFGRAMALAYRRIYRRLNNIAEVTVTTAAMLSDGEMAKIKEVAKKAFADATLEFRCIVNPQIIGGFIIDVDANRLDASVSNEIAQLRQNLLSSK